MKKVLLFGSFDILHPGHDYLITEAQKYGNLIIVLAQDSIITSIKGQKPQYNLEQRTSNLQKKYPEINIETGDMKLGSWSAIKKYQPEIIITGYDQTHLKSELEKIKNVYNFEIISLNSFHPEKFKSSLLRKEK